MSVPGRLLSVDPGLDVIAVATWDLSRTAPAGALRGVTRITSDAALSLPGRLADLGAAFLRLVWADGPAGQPGATVVIVEMPGGLANYARWTKPGQAKGVVQAMLDSSLATGVILATAYGAAQCLAIPADTTAKAKKQATALLFLRDSGMPAPAKPRKVWSGDELDAVYVGLRHWARARLLIAGAA